MKTIGVIGGLGPAASLDFHARLVARTDAARDQDHPRIIIDSNPGIPDRNQALRGEGPSPGPALAATARGLQTAGADIIVMACNAAHAWEAEIRAAISVPFLGMISETAAAVAASASHPRRVGVLAADACLAAGLYQAALSKHGLASLTLPEVEQRSFMDLIYRIKAGESGKGVGAGMRACAQSLVDAGADVIVAGCTEAPLVLGPGEVSVPLVDATAVLADRVLVAAGARLRD